MTELAVFSPSSTVTFSKCPRRWAIEKQGWKSRLIEYPELCAVLGNGFAKAMERYNTGLLKAEIHRPEVLVSVGVEEMEAQLAHEQAAGRRISTDGKSAEMFEKLPALLGKAIDLYLMIDPLQGWTILEAEKSYPEHGNARLDLLASDKDGPAVLDYKVKVNLKKEWEGPELEKHAKGWQRSHYAWMTGVKRFYIILVVLGPRPYVKLEPYLSTEYDDFIWQVDAVNLWYRMGQFDQNGSLLQISGSASHVDEWGACPYQSACLDYALDPQRMAVQYVQVERRKG